MDGQNWRDYFTDAIRFWEPMRLAYNFILGAIVLIYFGLGYPGSKSSLSIDGALLVFLLAVIANVAYCAAYPVDLFAQASAFRESWRKRRWILFAIGIFFAGIITRFYSMAMFLTPRK